MQLTKPDVERIWVVSPNTAEGRIPNNKREGRKPELRENVRMMQMAVNPASVGHRAGRCNEIVFLDSLEDYCNDIEEILQSMS